MAIRKSMNGEVYGHLTVLADAIQPKGKARKVTVQCVCGNTKDVFATSLRCGDTTSCGCKSKDASTTHGLTNTPLYRTWANMKARCDNPNAQYYSEYGGRGIGYCDEWKDFQTFYDWALANDYAQDLTLDREDNNAGYSPSNCRFVSRHVQQANRRAVHGYSGVTAPRKGAPNWKATIKVHGKSIHIGTYATELEASIARDDYVKANNLPHTLNH